MIEHPTDHPATTNRPTVAIVGAGLRVPGAASPTEFWDLLAAGRDTVAEIPRDRLDIDRWYSPEPGRPRSVNSRAGGFLNDIDQFDAGFFDIPPSEAEQLDPQQRLLLELTWEAIEDAGWTAERLAGSNTAVYLSTFNTDYWDVLRSRDRYSMHAVLGGTSNSMAAGRVNYLLDLRGPVMAVESACTTSLLTAHLAARALRDGDIDQAIVGAGNLMLSPDMYFALSEAAMLSPTGRCRFGDKSADGYVRSEGGVVLVLKRTEDAVRDGDRVYATILGSAVRGNGRTGGTLTSPGVESQLELLEAAYRDARVDPADVDFVEAHGSGTQAGDPVELNALAQVLGAGRDKPCLVGSVKTNIGHLEGVSGFAGLLKAALAVRHGVVPATLHVDDPLDLLAEPDCPLRLPDTAVSLADRRSLVAGVSAFGLSGANAHVVLGSPRRFREHPQRRHHAYLLPLSAKELPALRELAGRLGEVAATAPASSFADLCHTAGARRTHHKHRAAVVFRDRAELIAGLGAVAAGVPNAAVVGDGRAAGDAPAVVFIFPGQGSQWPAMGRELLREGGAFAAAMAECDAAVRAEVGWSPMEVLTSGDDLGGTDRVQPLLWAMQVSLAAQWRAWGIQPDLVIGHSMGEIAAAVTSGALTVDEGAAVVCRRSALLARHHVPGAMWAVRLDAATAARGIEGHTDKVAVGVLNSPQGTVLSGDPGVLQGIVARLAARGVQCSQVQVNYASHAPQVAPLGPVIEQALTDLRPRQGSVRMHSTVIDAVIDGTKLDGRYWAENLRLPVHFGTAVEHALASNDNVLLLEVSPHPVLHSALEDVIEATGSGAAIACSLVRSEPERATMLRTLAQAYVAGRTPNWALVVDDGRFTDVLPGYPWQRRRHWLDSGDRIELHHVHAAAPAEQPAAEPHRVAAAPATPAECLADVVGRAAAMLGVDPESADVEATLGDLGVTSLFAARLAYQLRSAYGVPVAIRELLAAPSVRALAELLHERVQAR